MESPTSLTQGAYVELRSELLACRFAPGEKLKIDDLCRRFAVGSSAVREALSRLASEGFVVSEPQRGFRVAPLSIEALRDLTNVRCNIEGLCLQGAIEKGGIEWQSQVVAALHRLSHTPVWADKAARRYSNEYAKAHEIFHEVLAAGCDSPWLLHLREMLFNHSERYRWFSGPFSKVERDLDREHREIAEAALARDSKRAVALMNEHLQKTASVILDSSLSEREQAPKSAKPRAVSG
ncbi:FCD domain-containing protein [Bradyrhizobium sp. LTSP849]|uniref:FCD domain-containing protein n=1 Tax=Bradyrhizobium sp. LTSP849 TaxID=1615890 RepID=UPI0005D268EE|nr:FCD domain-containing protein [Bradyrhizobium sp. LTSP849]